MITLTLEEIEIMLLGGTVFKDDCAINVSRETVDFYNGEKQLEESEQGEYL
jgi:hypothetical protein